MAPYEQPRPALQTGRHYVTLERAGSAIPGAFQSRVLPVSRETGHQDLLIPIASLKEAIQRAAFHRLPLLVSASNIIDQQLQMLAAMARERDITLLHEQPLAQQTEPWQDTTGIQPGGLVRVVMCYAAYARDGWLNQFGFAVEKTAASWHVTSGRLYGVFEPLHLRRVNTLHLGRDAGV